MSFSNFSSFSDISLIISSTFIISCSILSFGLSCYKTYRDTSLEIIKSRLSRSDISRSNDGSSDEVYILHSVSRDSLPASSESSESFTGTNEVFTRSNDFFVSEDYNSQDYTDINSDEFIEISLDLSQSNEIHNSDEIDINTKSIIERTKESIKVLYTNQINLEKFIKERVSYLDNEYQRLINFIQSSNSENQNNLHRYNNVLQYIENLSVT